MSCEGFRGYDPAVKVMVGHKVAHGRDMTATSTPWGPATLVERVTLPQRVGEKRFASLLELLEDRRGDRFVRVADDLSEAQEGKRQAVFRDLRRIRPGIVSAVCLLGSFRRCIDHLRCYCNAFRDRM